MTTVILLNKIAVIQLDVTTVILFNKISVILNEVKDLFNEKIKVMIYLFALQKSSIHCHAERSEASLQ